MTVASLALLTAGLQAEDQKDRRPPSRNHERSSQDQSHNNRGSSRPAEARQSQTSNRDRGNSQPQQQPSNAGRQQSNSRPEYTSPNVNRPSNSRQDNSNAGRPSYSRPESSNPSQRNERSRPAYSDAGGRQSTPQRAYDSGPYQRTRSGAEVRYGQSGRVTSFRREGVTVVHSPGQRITVTHPDGRVVVTNRAGHGFVQRDFVYSNRTYVTRTYYVRNNVYVRYYRPYVYHGVQLHLYVPGRYYSPGFYGWAYRPWGAPVYYRWGWVNDPWYRWYGPYWAPAPYYASPAYWLVDYLISSQLALAYQERQQQAAYAQGSQITPDIRALVADEVQRQLAAEGRDAQTLGQGQAGGDMAPDWLQGSSHVFVVTYNLDVQNAEHQVCSVTRGDVLQLAGPVPQGSPSAWVRVLASTASCPRGATVAVSLNDLQDMQNQMRESLSQGMGELYSKAGQAGMPALPQNAIAQPAAAAFMESAPAADQNVTRELQQQVQEADRLERETVAEATAEGISPASQPGGAGPGGTISRASLELQPGQSMEEVKAQLGEPLKVVRLGNKEIHTYQDVKVTYVNGKVQDIQ
mgnify:FL=1